MAHFAAQAPTGTLVQELEGLVRTAIFKPANALVGYQLQAAADRIDAAYQPKPGQARYGRVCGEIQALFGGFPLPRDYYYYHVGKAHGHYPADAALGLEVGYTPALARILCLAGPMRPATRKPSCTWRRPAALSSALGRSNGWCSASARTPKRGRTARSSPTNVARATRRCFT